MHSSHSFLVDPPHRRTRGSPGFPSRASCALTVFFRLTARLGTPSRSRNLSQCDMPCVVSTVGTFLCIHPGTSSLDHCSGSGKPCLLTLWMDHVDVLKLWWKSLFSGPPRRTLELARSASLDELSHMSRKLLLCLEVGTSTIRLALSDCKRHSSLHTKTDHLFLQ